METKLVYLEIKQADQNSQLEEISSVKRETSDESSDLEKEVKKIQYDNVNLQKGINDLDEQISNLDKQYQSISKIVDCKKSKLEKPDRQTVQLDSNSDTIKEQLLTKKASEAESDNWKCRSCDDSFATFVDFTQHMKFLHRKDSECKQCSQKFATSSLLENHMQDEHGTKKKHLCKDCGKAFYFEWRF